MLNRQGEVICAVSANVFAVFDNRLITPALDDCGVAGTVRQLILEELAPALGLDATEERINWADLQQAEELFLTNALQGIRAVAACPGLSFTSTRCGDNLRERFFDWSDNSTA
jgi:4-amino-4-deoxychorismate lyase